MRSDCCTNEISFAIWATQTYYSFWDVVNRKKWLRPLYNLHYRILCWRNQADWEDMPGLYDEDNPLNPEKFFKECRSQRSDDEILLSASFEAEVKRITIIMNDVGIDYSRLMHKKDGSLERYCFYLYDAVAAPEQAERLERLCGYKCYYSETEKLLVIDSNGKFDDYGRYREEDDEKCLNGHKVGTPAGDL